MSADVKAKPTAGEWNYQWRDYLTGRGESRFMLVADRVLPNGFREQARICTVGLSSVGTKEISEANARLLSAAPNLLKALRELIEDVIDKDHDPRDWSEQVCVKNAQAAIAKAEGTPAT